MLSFFPLRIAVKRIDASCNLFCYFLSYYINDDESHFVLRNLQRVNKAGGDCRGKVGDPELIRLTEKSVFNLHSNTVQENEMKAFPTSCQLRDWFWKTELDLVINAVVSSQSSL